MALRHDEHATRFHCNLLRFGGRQDRDFEFSIQDVEQLVGVGMKLPRTRVTGEATDVHSAGAERREFRKRSGVFLGRRKIAGLSPGRRVAFEGVTGFYYNATLQTMWRAYLLREQIGESFDELVNVVVLWSALRRGAHRESGYEADRDLLAKYKQTLFRRFVTGKLRKGLVPLRKAETLGHALVERISRRSMSAGERRAQVEHPGPELVLAEQEPAARRVLGDVVDRVGQEEADRLRPPWPLFPGEHRRDM